MALDSLLVRALVHEIGPQVVRSRIERIHQPDDSSLYLRVFPPRDGYLAIGAAPRRPHLLLTVDRPPSPPSPLFFCQLLRARLEGGVITGLEQVGLDRVVSLAVTGKEGVAYLLVAELFGPMPDVLLVEREGSRIVGRLRRGGVPARLAEGVWSPPASTLAPLEEAPPDLGRFARLVAQSRGEEVANRSLEGYLAAVREHRYRPSRVRLRSDHILLAPWEALPEGAQVTSFESVAELCRVVLVDEVVRGELEARRERVARQLDRMIERESARLAHARENLAGIAQAATYERWGNLLKSNIASIKPYRDSIEVVDYYDPGGKSVTIPLKPQLAPRQNVERYFLRAKRMKKSRPLLESRVAGHEANAALLESIRAELAGAADRDALNAVEARITGLGRAHDRRPADRAAGPLEFVSSDGYRILVGRNARENDLVSRKLARPHDVWLHASGLQGAHVVVKMRRPDEECPDRTLVEAAQLAAHYSKGRYAAKVEVTHTRARHVKKAPGGPAGQVLVGTHRTIVVPADPHVASRLSKPL